MSSSLPFAWRDSIAFGRETSCSNLKPAEVSQWKTVRLFLDACVWLRCLTTVLMYINTKIGIFDRAVFNNFYTFISAEKLCICTGKTTYLSVKKWDHCLMTQ